MLLQSDGVERWYDDAVVRRRAWTAAGVASVSQVLYMVDATLMALSLPGIARQFDDVPRSTLGWAATGFLVAQSSLLLVGGRLGDRHGRKRAFLAGMAMFTLGALLTSLAPSAALLIAARVLQGAGAAFLTSGALALVLPMFPTEKSAVVIGMWGMVGSVAAWTTPTIGALVVERSWRLGFALIIPLGIAAIVAGRRLLVERAPAHGNDPTDRLSFLVGPPACGLTMVLLAKGGSWGWTSAPTVALAVVTIGLAAALLWRSRVAAEPLLELGIFRTRAYTANVLAGSLQQAGFFAWFLTAPLIMDELWGWSVREIGLALALGQVLATLGSPLGGQIVLRWGSNAAVALGAVCIVAGVVWQIVTVSAAPHFWTSYMPMAMLLGFGSGMAGTVTTGAALAALPDEQLGAGNSLVQLIRRMGGALGVAIGIALLGNGTGAALLDGAQRAWVFVAVIHAAMLIPLVLARGERARRPAVATAPGL